MEMTSPIESTATLREVLKTVAAKNAQIDWLKSLNERKKAELEFHNMNRDKSLQVNLPEDTYEMLYGNKKYYTTVQLSREYVSEWIKTNAKGKVFLDYACGNGENALLAGKSGAALSIGLDISDVSVANATESATKLGIGDRTMFMQGDCENTGLPDNCIDTIICSGMLHHLDLSYAFPELRRILKPGGRILGVEALDYNPFIKAYRLMTPSMRTDWEKNHILSMKDIRFAKRFFEVEDIRFWHLFSIFAAYFSKNETLQRPILGLFNFLDRVLTKVPGVRLMAWQFTFVLKKPLEK